MSYTEIERQISLGNLWRAKEILQGRLVGSRYDTDLYERYGNVLLEMKDDLEAGKFLFLSGVQKPEYEKAKYLYLDRYGGKPTGGLFHTFPHSAQVSPIEDFPESVLAELEKNGHNRSAVKGQTRPKNQDEENSSLSEKLGIFFVLLLVFLIVGGFIVQGIRGVVWVFQWLF
ncbi:MAG: hypothetical protein NPIRA05_14020 [Nitrospirales bacterium]|nr:MAG: hypothetical protein NPIRA05_14020 [Nitrospirales bacterium]